MIPVDQTKFYIAEDGVTQRGNCWTACIASIMERPIDSVPNFVEIDVAGGQNWFTHTWQWLQANGYRLQNLVHGEEPEGEYYIATGASPRGFNLRHAVVYKDRQLAFDPHPSREGIRSYEAIFGVVPD